MARVEDKINDKLGKYLNEIKELKQCLLYSELSYEYKQAERDVLKFSNCNLLYTQFFEILCHILCEIEGERYTEKSALEKHVVEKYPNPYVVNTIYIANEKLFDELRNNEIQNCGEKARQNPIDYVEDYCKYIKEQGLAIRFSDLNLYEYVGHLIYSFESEIIWNRKLCFDEHFDYLNDFLRYITFRQYLSKRCFTFDEIMGLADEFICEMKENCKATDSVQNYQKKKQ